MRKQVIFAVFSLIILAMSFGQTQQGRAAVVEVNQTPDDQLPAEGDVTVVEPQMSVQTDEESDVLKTQDPTALTLTEVKNESKSRFVATIYNNGPTDLVLESFLVLIFNETSNVEPESTLEYVFPTETSGEVKLGTRTAKTQSLNAELAFKTTDETYRFHIGFNYVLTSNRSLKLFAGGEYNFSLLAVPGIPDPPELLLWVWYGVTFLIIAQVVFGVIGNRRIKYDEE